MAFHDVRLPEEVEKGAQGGPAFSTTIAPLVNGYEQRNRNWSTARAMYDVSYGIDGPDLYEEVLAFFYARAGMFHSFRFKDWSDYTIGDDDIDSPEAIGTGNGVEADFQIIKTYTSGIYTYVREITRPVTGTTRVFVNGVEKTLTTHFTVSATTGIVSFTLGNEPANGETVAVITEFDVPVRFDTDMLTIAMEAVEAGAIPGISIKEVLGE